jgi:hypothetical protein
MVEGRRPRKPPEILERAAKNPPASRAWNGQRVVVGTGESLLGPAPTGGGSEPTYNRQPREVAGGREAVGGGRSSDDGRDNTTRPERRAPASSVHEKERRNPDECRAIG